VAARKLVDGRRAFGEVMTQELLEFTNSDKGKDNDHVRKLYALSGHGVPNSLFEHFISMGREWLRCQNAVSSSANNLHIAKPVSSLKSPSQSPSSAIHLALRNIPNCTIFDREKILKTNASGTTSLIQWPMEWDHDLELYMVVMNRIGSRLSSIVLKQDVNEPAILTNDDMSTGSVIIPSHLNKWNVSIRKGEVLPFYLLPTSGKENDLVLTAEWLYNSVDCWTIVLRLQDDFVGKHAAYKGLIKDPIALVFEGVYVARNPVRGIKLLS
jgi:nitrogen fixation protein